MIDIVKRLRNGEPADSQYSNELMGEAADEIERLRKESEIHASNTLAAIDDYNDALAEIAKLREALEKIAAELDRLRSVAGDDTLQEDASDPWAGENQRIYDEKEARISGDDKRSL